MLQSHTKVPTWSPLSPALQCSTWLYTCERTPAAWPGHRPLVAGWWQSRRACCETSTGGCRNLATVWYESPAEKFPVISSTPSKQSTTVAPVYQTRASPAHSLPPCRLERTPPCCSLGPASTTCQWAGRCCLQVKWCRELPEGLYVEAAGLVWSGRCWKRRPPCIRRSPRWWPRMRRWFQSRSKSMKKRRVNF